MEIEVLTPKFPGYVFSCDYLKLFCFYLRLLVLYLRYKDIDFFGKKTDTLNKFLLLILSMLTEK